MVVQAGTAEAQEVGLHGERQFRLLTLHQRETRVPIQVASQVFF